MDRSQIKSYKERLRRIQDHLQEAHLALGVEHEQVGFADIFYHPQYTLPALNYVTPRRKTALVPGRHIEDGLNILRQHRRQGQVCFMDGLYPKFFEQTLTQIGLTLKKRSMLWVYDDSLNDGTAPELPSDLSVTTVVKGQGIAIWWYVWRNAGYHIYTNQIEPLQVGRQPDADPQENLIDLILYRYDTPVAVARMTLHNGSAHIIARALLQSTRLLQTETWLLQSAIQTAYQQNCDLIFLSGDDTRAIHSAHVAFMAAGSVLCYTDTLESNQSEFVHEPVEQPVLLI